MNKGKSVEKTEEDDLVQSVRMLFHLAMVLDLTEEYQRIARQTHRESESDWLFSCPRRLDQDQHATDATMRELCRNKFAHAEIEIQRLVNLKAILVCFDQNSL